MATPATAVPSSGPLLNHLARLLRTRSEEAIAPLGLRPRHLIPLTLLREQDGSATQQALAAALQIDRTNLVGLLNELEAESLVIRRRASEDRRRHIVELTPTGRRQLAKADRKLGATEEEVLGALDPEERAMLYRLLQRATAGQTLSCMAAASSASDR